MNKRFDPSANPVLSSIIDNIETALKCSKFQEYKNLIDIDIWENVKFKMPHNKKIAENGFGFCISNYFEYAVYKRIIIINMENCNRLNFSEREIAAIIYHELGHLLNGPELIEVPTIMYCLKNGIEYNKDLEEEASTKNSVQKEIFADSYANQKGYGGELLLTFLKQNQYLDQKIGYFEARVEKINNNELFDGVVMPIDTNF